jgi:tetratricopeptide (TPR) repeat protein
LNGGEYQLAAADFGVCVGLWPEFAWGYFNLGCAHDRGGRKEAALGYYTAALDRAPDFPDALLNRGLAHLGAGRHAEALADFSRAVAVRPDDPAVHAGRGLALEGLGRAGEADAAFRGAFARLANAPDHVRTRVRLGYGFAVYRRLPRDARDAFEAILRQTPGHPEALYGLAVVAAAGGDTAEAIGLLDRCIAAAPDAKDAALCRAILVARVGRPGEAFPVIDRYLGRDPDDGTALYAGACVAALAAKRWAGTAPGQAAAGQAVDLLRRALARGQPSDRAARDPDLAAIRNRPEVRQLIGGAKPTAP